MLLFFSLLLLLSAAAILDTVGALRTDGYGPRSAPPGSHAEEYPQWSTR
ncbi:hypothetical protein [Naasia sp. SYSU D00057]|nr:hypothetical protein [Naasia sp. SYSU D00057]